MRLSNCILITLLDGEPHSTQEIYPYVAKRIDPSKAVRTYNIILKANRKKREAKTGRPTVVRKVLPKEKQVEKGSWQIFSSSLWHLTKKGIVAVTAEPDVKNRSVQLTAFGKALLSLSGGRNSVLHYLWKELKKWYAEGMVRISLNGIPGETPPSARHEHEEKTEEPRPEEEPGPALAVIPTTPADIPVPQEAS